MKKMLTALTFLAMLTGAAQCDMEAAANHSKGNWNCEFETDMGVALLTLQVTETRGDSALGTYSYSTQYTGLVSGKIRGKITITDQSVTPQKNDCAFRISGKWSEVTSGGITGTGNFIFDFTAGISFKGFWTEAGGSGKWKWDGTKSSRE